MIPNEHRGKLHRALNEILNVLNYPYGKKEAREKLEGVAKMITDVVDSLERKNS